MNATAPTEVSILLTGWRTIKGKHCCPDCWEKSRKKLSRIKAAERDSLSISTIGVAEKDRLILADGYVICSICDTMIITG